MKRRIISISLMLAVFASTVVAGEPEPGVSPAVTASFQKQFSQVKDVKWTVYADYSRAEFYYAYSRVEAFFSNTGEYLGSARNLLFSQLPISVVNAVEQRFGKAGTYEVIEHNSPVGPVYHLTVETSTKKYRIKVTPDGDLSVIKKTKI
jgi:hypothetical protein